MSRRDTRVVTPYPIARSVPRVTPLVSVAGCTIAGDVSYEVHLNPLKLYVHLFAPYGAHAQPPGIIQLRAGTVGTRVMAGPNKM